MFKNFTETDASMFDDIIEHSKTVKITNGSVYTMIFIDGIIKCGLFFNKKSKDFTFKQYDSTLIKDIIKALGTPEDIGAEKLLASLLMYEFANIKNKRGE